MAVIEGPISEGAAPAARPEASGGLRKRPATRAMVAVALFVVGVAALIPILQDSDATAKGYEIRDLERTRDDWRSRSRAVEAEIARLGSIDRVRREATGRLGMVTPVETIFLKVEVSGLSVNRAPLRYLPEEAVAVDIGDERPLWERVLDGLLP